MMKKYYFTMKTADEIPLESRRAYPIYMMPYMNEIAERYKNVVIAFFYKKSNNTFVPIDDCKYNWWAWHKDWLKETSAQLEFDW